MRGFVVDGNFKADHVRQRRPEDDVWLTSGEGMTAEPTRYKAHLKLAKETKEARSVNLTPLSISLKLEYRKRIPATVPSGHWKRPTCRDRNKMTLMGLPAMPVPGMVVTALGAW